MKEQIIKNLDYPEQLEKLYRDNKNDFKQAFNEIYPQLNESKTVRIWYERLNYESSNLSSGSKKEIAFIIATSLLAGLIAKLPDFTSIDPDFFYPRNIAFIIFPLLIIYISWKQKQPLKQLSVIFGVIVASIFYLNLLPDNPESDTLILACIHLPLLLWAMLGIAFTGGALQNRRKYLNYLRFNGDLLVMAALLFAAGVIFSGVTIGLFSLIDISAEDFYFKHVAIWGAVAIPFISTYIVLTSPHFVNKISPLIAKIFTPIVLVTLTVYLVAIVITGKNPYSDREFLLVFNIMLVAIMALIMFSIPELTKSKNRKTNLLLLFLLSILTIVINAIALSAIMFRISELGLTPNRLAVLGSNILILAHLSLVSYNIFKSLKNQSSTEEIDNSIALYLPVYVVWFLIVSFLFPVLFGFS